MHAASFDQVTEAPEPDGGPGHRRVNCPASGSRSDCGTASLLRHALSIRLFAYMYALNQTRVSARRPATQNDK